MHLSEENDIKEGVQGALKRLFIIAGEWRPSVTNFGVWSIDIDEAIGLEVPFTEDEVFKALLSFSGD